MLTALHPSRCTVISYLSLHFVKWCDDYCIFWDATQKFYWRYQETYCIHLLGWRLYQARNKQLLLAACMVYASVLKTEAVYSSKTFKYFYYTRPHIPKNHNDRRENSKSNKKIYKSCSSKQLTFYDIMSLFNSVMSRLWENLKFIWTSCKVRVTDRSKVTAIKRYMMEGIPLGAIFSRKT
jgi:hypothetical protein